MTAAGEPVVEARGLFTQFGERVIHQDLDFSTRRGEIMGLVGGSGTGKSVLLNTLIGLRRPDAGEVRIFGEPLHQLENGPRTALERRFGVLFQNGALFSSLTVKENVQTPLREHANTPVPLMEDIAEMKIALAGLPMDAAHKLPAELSGGMRKRAGLARALALDPDILFLDEPTAGLDPLGAADFDQLILKLRAALGLTVVMVTHDLDSLHAICDRIAVLADRRVIAVDTPAALLRSDHPWIRAYFNGPRGRAAVTSTAQGDRAAEAAGS